MPNWCAGSIRFRGKLADIFNLLRNELKYCYYGDDRKTHIIDIFDYDFDESFDPDECSLTIWHPRLPEFDSNRTGWWHWNNTQRAFLDGEEEFGEIYAKFYEHPKPSELYTVFVDGFRQAWSIVPEDFIEYSRKYGVDIALFGWECGMQFHQHIEIVDGEITRNDREEYKDLYWESARPFVGG